MKKIILFLKLILRSKFIFKTPKKYDLVVFDKMSLEDLNNLISKFNFFVLQVRLEDMNEIYLSYKIFKKVIKNYSKGNLFTVYLTSLIELIGPKVVITNIDNSLKFSDIAKILEKKKNFIAIQNSSRAELLQFYYLYNTKRIKHNFLNKFYIPTLFTFGNYEKELYKKLNIVVKNIYPVGNLRWSNFLHHIKSENGSHERFNSDICLISEYVVKNNAFHAAAAFGKDTQRKINESMHVENTNIENGISTSVKYTIKFCIKNNMKLIIPLKRSYKPNDYQIEFEFYKRILDKNEFEYFKANLLKKNRENFSSYRAVLNSKIAVGTASTLLRDKLGVGGKILSCNQTKLDIYNFPIKGICSLNNCSYLEFEKRMLEIYSMSKEEYFSKIDKKPNYLMRYEKDNSTLNLIKEKLYQLGLN